jgi:hypothetical protein
MYLKKSCQKKYLLLMLTNAKITFSKNIFESSSTAVFHFIFVEDPDVSSKFPKDLHLEEDQSLKMTLS